MDLADFKFSILQRTDNLSSFDCGSEDITEFLKEDALFYQNESLANTYIFWGENDFVAAFFSISTANLSAKNENILNRVWNRIHRVMNLPNEKRIRQYPAVLVGRLGVHLDYHKTGLAYQLMDFIKEFSIQNMNPACRLLLLDAVNQDRQINYYKKNDFFLLDPECKELTAVMIYDLDRLK